MKLFIFTLFLTLFSSGLTWKRIALNQTDPAHPGKCVVHGLVLSPGEERKPEGRCMRIICVNESGDTATHGCGTTVTDPPCRVGGTKYPNELYPKCCEKEIICPDGIQPTRTMKTG